MDPETHKEIVEIRKDISELRHAQDSVFHHDRNKYESMVSEGIDGDPRAAKIVLMVDGSRSLKEIERTLGIPQKSCWRKFDRLEANGVIYRTGETKNGSPIYQVQRWFRKLRMEEYVQKNYLKEAEESSGQQQKLSEKQVIQSDKPSSMES